MRSRRPTSAKPSPESASPPTPSGLVGDALFTALCDDVRDYAIFLMDEDGVITYWGEGTRLMKWWTREQVIADSELHAQRKGVTLVDSVSGAARDLPYWGDEGRVRPIVSNLLTNAVKFTSEGGQVTISAGTADAPEAALSGGGPWAWVRVEDTGIGIPADRLAEIFEPYGQVHLTDAASGTGLGLSIARRLARLMGGDLTVQSEVGKGSQFFLWPAVDATSPTVPR